MGIVVSVMECSGQALLFLCQIRILFNFISMNRFIQFTYSNIIQVNTWVALDQLPGVPCVPCVPVTKESV